MTLSRRLTEIGGDTAPDDHTIFDDGHACGRIYKTHGPNATVQWFWGITAPVGRPTSGRADTFEAASDQWKQAWDTFRAALSDADVKRWYNLEAAVKGRFK